MQTTVVKTSMAPLRPPGWDVDHILSQRAASVERFVLFSGIPQTDRIRIVSTAQERRFTRRQTIFFEGDPIRHVILLTSGCVKKTQLGPNGQEVILRVEGPGEIVGAVGLCPTVDPCSMTRIEHCSTARALQLSSALVWETAQFEAISERFPLLRRNTAHILEQNLHELEERFREISTEKVSPRLSSQLLRLLKQVGKEEQGQVEIALSRRDMAQLTGMTLFTVSRLICQWQEKGIVSARRAAVLVCDVPALVELSQKE